jgi:hypothetical protein
MVERSTEGSERMELGHRYATVRAASASIREIVEPADGPAAQPGNAAESG